MDEDGVTVTSGFDFDSEDAAVAAAASANGESYDDADAAAAAGVTITPGNVVLSGSLPWGGIPSNGGTITESDLSNQNYTRSALGIPETSFGSTGAWGTHCGRKKWALDNGIAWDGVSNSNVDCSNYLGGGNPDDVYSTSINDLYSTAT